MMNRLILVALGFIFLMPVAPAQDNLSPEKRQQLEAFQVAFITRRLSLTPNEAKLFWPVYDSYKAELEKNKREMRRRQLSARGNFYQMSDAELEELADALMENQKKEYDIRARYHEQFKEVLPIRKVVLLYKAETDLNRELLKKIQESRRNN
jgi:hypothetical protein